MRRKIQTKPLPRVCDHTPATRKHTHTKCPFSDAVTLCRCVSRLTTVTNTVHTQTHTSRARAYTRMSLGKLRKDYGVVAAKHYHTAVLDPRWRACYFRCSDCSFPCFLRNTFVLMMRLLCTLVRFVAVGIFSLFHLPTLKTVHTSTHTHTRAQLGANTHTPLDVFFDCPRYDDSSSK